MVGRELVVRKEAAVSLREVAARTTLREVRQKGHTYVEIRHVGKRIIFFCTLCLTPCYSDNVLFDHLRGNLHARRLAAAKVTLFGPTPWPFNDGVLFFDNSSDKEPFSSVSDGQNDMAIVVSNQQSANDDEVTSGLQVNSNSVHNMNCSSSRNHNKNGLKSNCCAVSELQIAVNGHKGSLRSRGRVLDIISACNGTGNCLMIAGVLLKEEISSLRVRHLGVGQIACRIQESKDARGKITRMWCAWLGQGDSDQGDELKMSANCDFAVVNFPYTYGLGRKGSLDDEDSPVSPGSFFEIDDSGNCRRKKIKSFSDQEDYSDCLTDNCASPSRDCLSFDSFVTDDSQQLEMRLIPSKTVRRELRKQKRLAAERTCDICGQPMLPGKDVATLLNCKTGNLACSSRNTNGAFHPFHASCLIHWILLCELEMAGQTNNAKSTRGRKGRSNMRNRISSVFCPECQGTGVFIQGEELEKPTIPLSEMFLYKLKAIEANKSWMKNPEILHRCSTGLHFPTEHVDILQEKVMPLKLLHFLRVAD